MLGFPYMDSSSPAFQFDDLPSMPTRHVSRDAKQPTSDSQETYIRASMSSHSIPRNPHPPLPIFGLHLLVVDPCRCQVSVLQLCAGHGEASISDTHQFVPLSALPHRARPTPARRHKRRISWLEDFRSRGSWLSRGVGKSVPRILKPQRLFSSGGQKLCDGLI